MVEAIPIAAAQAQLLAARLFAQATAQGQAILAAAAGNDVSNDQPQTGGNPGQGGAALLLAQQGGQQAPPGTAAGADGAAAGSPAQTTPAPANPLPGAASPTQTAAPATPAPPAILTRAALVEDLAQPTIAPQTPASTPTTSGPAAAAPQPPTASPAPPLPSAPQAAPTSPAVSFARLEAVTRQDTAAPLLADLETVVAQNLAPPQVRMAARAVLAAALPLEPNVSGEDLKAAAAKSGLFLEARLAAPQASGPQINADGKGALLSLLRALRIWSAPAAPEEPSEAAEDGPQSEEGPDAARTSAAAAGKTAPSAPPPIKGQPPRPQPPAGSTLAADATPTAVRAQLIKRTDAALARTTLLQLASSESSETRAASSPGSASWLFELPVTTPQGPTTLPFEIDRDGGGGAPGAPEAVAWRVRFGLDVEPVGPVFVQAQLRGTSAAVTVLAERPGVADALSRRAAELTDSLASEGLTAHVTVSNGVPAAPAAAPGRFLDRAT